MRFSVWFKMWLGAFCKLFSFDYRKPKSDYQRKRERKKRIEAKHSSANFYRMKKRYKKRRSHSKVQNEKLLKSMLGFVGATFGVLLLPFGLLDWRMKSSKSRKLNKVGRKTKTAHYKAEVIANESKVKKTNVSALKEKHKKMQLFEKEDNKTVTKAQYEIKQGTHEISGGSLENFERNMREQRCDLPSAAEPNESIPKSIPKNEEDRYIRKRMIIAGSFYCDREVLDTLTIGSYIDLEAEPNNPYDKDAVKLLFDGQKIGYISKEDRLAFITCLRLGQTIYGVITAIKQDDKQTMYEFETWFGSRK